jgi:hypothetical protein
LHGIVIVSLCICMKGLLIVPPAVFLCTCLHGRILLFIIAIPRATGPLGQYHAASTHRSSGVRL